MAEAHGLCGGENGEKFGLALFQQYKRLCAVLSERHHGYTLLHSFHFRYKVSSKQAFPGKVYFRLTCISIDSPVLSLSCLDTLRPLLPPAARGQLHLPNRTFSITYDLNFASLCENFVDIDFHFSLGLTFLVNRFLGPAKAKQALSLLDQKLQVTVQVFFCLFFYTCFNDLIANTSNINRSKK